MKEPRINNRSNWRVLDAAADSLARGEKIPSASFAAIADRLRSAIESPDAQRVETASALLEDFLRSAIASAPPQVQAVSRGEMTAGSIQGRDAGYLYALGKVAFAQLLAARIADTRVDGRFIEHVLDRRYLPMLLALKHEPVSVTGLHERTGERMETVSRKLGLLRGLGIVASRKQGNVVMNFLTPAAEEVLALHAAEVAAATTQLSAPDAGTTTAGLAIPDEDARDLLDEVRSGLPDHMQNTPLFRGRPLLRAVG